MAVRHMSTGSDAGGMPPTLSGAGKGPDDSWRVGAESRGLSSHGLGSSGRSVHSRTSNVRDEADAEEVQNLWQENQDLHERILGLELRLQEVEVERGALNLQNPTPSAQDFRVKSLRSRRTHFSMPMDTTERLVSLRSRLRWQKAIFTVRSQIKAVKNFSDRLKLTASELALQAAREVPGELQREIEQEKWASEKRWAQVEMERNTLSDLFAVEKSNLERENQNLKDRMFELERASHLGLATAEGSLEGAVRSARSSRNSQQDTGDEEDELLPRMLSTSPGVSLMEDLRSPLRSVAVDPSSEFATASVPNFQRSTAANNQIEEYEEMREETENLRNWTQNLESKLTGFAAEKEELVMLRQRVRQLEKAAREEKQRTEREAKQVEESPWWSLGWGNIFCSAARQPEPVAPFTLPERGAPAPAQDER